MLPQTESEVFALFSPPSRLTIENIISEGRILTTPSDEAAGSLEAHVAGNRPRPYAVSIALDEHTDLQSSFCECQAAAPCPHIAAVWISELRRREGPPSGLQFSRLVADRFAIESDTDTEPAALSPKSSPGPITKDGPFSMPNPLDSPFPQPQTMTLPKLGAIAPGDQVEFQREIARILGYGASDTSKSDNLQSAPSGERWRLGFLLDSLQLPLPARNGKLAGFRRALAVKPCLVFLRRDDQEGRLRDFDPALLTEPASQTELVWLDLIQGQGGLMELDRMLMLAELPEQVALPRIRSGTGQDLDIRLADHLEIRFRPHALPWGSREIDFKAELIATTTNQSIIIRSFECGLRRILMVADGGIIAWLPHESRLATLLDLLNGRRMQLDPGEIRQLQTGLVDNAIPRLSISLNGETTQRCLCRGQAILGLESASGGDGLWATGQRATFLRVEIDWDFGDAEPETELEPDWTRVVGINPEDSSATLWVRDLGWETELIVWLRRELASLMAANDKMEDPPDFSTATRIDGRYHAIPDSNGLIGQLRSLEENRAFGLNIELNAFLRDWGARLMEAGFALKLRRDAAASTRGSVNINVDHGLDWLDFEAEIATFSRGKGSPGARRRAAKKARAKALTPQRREELAAIQDLLSHRIVRGTERLILLSPEDAVKLQRLLDLGLEPGKRHRIAHGDIGTLAALPVPEGNHIREVEKARELVEKLTSLDRQTMESPEPGFTTTLRGYQRRGFSWLLHMHESGLGACLADDMGLGKTVQALAFFQTLAARDPRDFHALLIAPVSTLPNWQSETSRFTPNLRTYLHHGGDRNKAQDFSAAVEKVELCLVSFATLRNDIALFSQREWNVVLVDEAQNIKNPESATFSAIKTLKARQRISLTGTPVENGVRDLWAQMDFINPGMLGGLKRFASRYASSIEERSDHHALTALRRIVSPFVLRRRKEEVARDLPAKEEILLYCDLGPAQRKIYEDIKEAFRVKIDEAVKMHGVAKSAMTILEALLRLRQACLFPDLINPDWIEAGSAKADLLVDLMGELAAEEHKALIFSQFTQVLDRIGNNLKRDSYDYVRLDGQSANRAEPVARFQNDPDCRLFLISLKAGGVGINLTAADYVILFDPWWNPAVENQAIDRAHRIGRDKPVIVYRLIARDTVEEKMLTLQERKRELAGALTDSDDTLMGSMNPGELLELLG